MNSNRAINLAIYEQGNSIGEQLILAYDGCQVVNIRIK